jgi:hypothetical protein
MVHLMASAAQPFYHRMIENIMNGKDMEGSGHGPI